MSSNPYAPPLAKVEDTPGSPGDFETGLPQFYQVASWKLVVMSFATLGFYVLYWSYEHWRIVRMRERSDIWPVPRAIFSVFYVYGLFNRIRADGMARQLSNPPAAGPLAVAWILFSLAWRLPGALAFLGMVSWLVLIPIQDYASRINAQVTPNAPRNDRLTWLNWVAVVVAILFWALVLIGLLLPAAER